MGVSPDPDKIKALEEWLQHPLKNASELQTFLSFARYYRSFVEGFAQTAKPLHQSVAQQSKKQLQRNHSFNGHPLVRQLLKLLLPS